MRKIYAVFIALFITVSVWAQSPQKMSYQAVIRNSSNQLVANQKVGMQITILQGSATGTEVYSETQTPTTNANGLVSIEIGGGTGFSSIDWSTGSYFIKTETDPTGGNAYTITGTSQLLSVPYALYAKTSGSSTTGLKGDQRIQGEQGSKGDTGLQGIAGVDGKNGTNGAVGATGSQGADGKSAYQLWLDADNTGDMAAFIVGNKGATGDQGIKGETGLTGAKGDQGNTGLQGSDGKSAYQLWLDAGNTGDMVAFIVGNKGATGDQGIKGEIGLTGANGDKGDQGIAGTNGVDGKSTYQLWLDAGNTGDMATFILGNKGTTGDQGIKGDKGDIGAQGIQGIIGADGINGTNGIDGAMGLQGSIGLTGATGAVGAIGSQGPIGLIGAKGTNGGGIATAGTKVTVTGIGTIANPYVVNATTNLSLTHYAGELYGGGVVFWVDQTGNHGLICSMVDLSTNQAWHTGSTTPMNAHTSIALSDWDGLANTNAIIAQSTTSAANLCKTYTNIDYGTGTYSDWYLPALGQLNKLYDARYEVQKALESDGNNATTAIIRYVYWSSTNGGMLAYGVNFLTGEAMGTNSTYDYRVRAIRSF